MKISIVIDDALMAAAMQASQLGSRQKTVELALRNLVQLSQEETLRPWRGKLRWDGDLESMRLDADPRFKSNVIKSKRAKAKGSFRAIHRILKGRTNGALLTPDQINDAIAETGAQAGAGSR